MDNLLDRVKRDVGHLKCPACGKSPEIRVIGDRVQTTACNCKEFATSYQKQVQKSVESSIKKSMDDMFKKMGRR